MKPTVLSTKGQPINVSRGSATPKAEHVVGARILAPGESYTINNATEEPMVVAASNLVIGEDPEGKRKTFDLVKCRHRSVPLQQETEVVDLKEVGVALSVWGQYEADAPKAQHTTMSL